MRAMRIEVKAWLVIARIVSSYARLEKRRRKVARFKILCVCEECKIVVTRSKDCSITTGSKCAATVATLLLPCT